MIRQSTDGAIYWGGHRRNREFTLVYVVANEKSIAQRCTDQGDQTRHATYDRP